MLGKIKAFIEDWWLVIGVCVFAVAFWLAGCEALSGPGGPLGP